MKKNKIEISTVVLAACIIAIALSIKVIHMDIDRMDNKINNSLAATQAVNITDQQAELFQALHESNATTTDDKYNFICEKMSVKEYVNMGILPSETEAQYEAWRVTNYPVELEVQGSYKQEIEENLPVFEFIYETHQRSKATNDTSEMDLWCEQLVADQYVVMEQLPENGTELYKEWRLQAHPLEEV